MCISPHWLALLLLDCVFRINFHSCFALSHFFPFEYFFRNSFTRKHKLLSRSLSKHFFSSYCALLQKARFLQPQTLPLQRFFFTRSTHTPLLNTFPKNNTRVLLLINFTAIHKLLITFAYLARLNNASHLIPKFLFEF